MYNIIKELEEDNSRLAKESILRREARANNTGFFDGVRMALDNFITFGVKKVPTHGGPDGQGLPWEVFATLATQLYMRELTGNDAKDAIELVMGAATQDEWNYWYRRILIKDLRCGISEKTVNKIVKGTAIEPVPVFECMLAHDGANHEKKIAGTRLLEPKLDGVRCLTIIDYDNKTVIQYTRNGKVLENFGHITEGIRNNIELFQRSFVLDGEVVSHTFQDLMKQVHRKDDVQAADARLCLFDIIPLSEFRAGASVMKQRTRSNMLRSLTKVFDKCVNIDVIPQQEVDLDTMVGQLEFKQYNADAIAAGYEGIMIKDPNAVYECKRTTSWLKQKPFIEVSLPVVAVEEGTGRNAGKLGALVCEGIDDGKNIVVNVGSGLTDADRAEIWQDKDAVIGQIVEIRADAATMNQDSDNVWSLRFPRFMRFRGFTAGEKI